MTARIEDQAPPDTARRHLLTLARRQVAMPWLSVVDELSLLSVIADAKARERAFDELCRAIADHEPAVMEAVLDLLTGRLR